MFRYYSNMREKCSLIGLFLFSQVQVIWSFKFVYYIFCIRSIDYNYSSCLSIKRNELYEWISNFDNCKEDFKFGYELRSSERGCVACQQEHCMISYILYCSQKWSSAWIFNDYSGMTAKEQNNGPQLLLLRKRFRSERYVWAEASILRDERIYFGVIAK